MNTLFWPLLALLADGRPHDPAALAQQLNCSVAQLERAWQAMPERIRHLLVKSLQSWQLCHPLALLPEQTIADIAGRHGFKAQLLPETTSTNSVLLEQLRTEDELPQGRLCISYLQTAGRGRQGRLWHNQIGDCLMFSLVWSFQRSRAELGGLALVVALAVAQTLREQQVNVQIKWPNDLVLGLDKLGGILIETAARQGCTQAVIGIGLNMVLPAHLPQVAALNEMDMPVDVGLIFDGILGRLARDLPLFDEAGLTPFLPAYQQLHRDHLQRVYLLKDGQPFARGLVSGIAASGALKLRMGQKEREFVSGEISLRPEAGMITNRQTVPEWYLLLDAGNSKLKWAWVHGHQIVHTNRAAYYNLQKLASDWAHYGHQVSRIVGCAVCGEDRMQQIAQILPRPISWLSSMSQGLGIHNHYRRPSEHGADRWFNLLGSRRYSDRACVVVSCGTAVTVDALTDDNHYLGGSILPGFYLMREALAQRTANLNQPLGRPYAFATTTSNALASGLMDAVCGAIVLMYERLQQKIGQDKVIDLMITGGGASKVAQALPATFTLDKRIEIVDNLVIYGLLNWVEHS